MELIAARIVHPSPGKPEMAKAQNKSQLFQGQILLTHISLFERHRKTKSSKRKLVKSFACGDVVEVPQVGIHIDVQAPLSIARQVRVADVGIDVIGRDSNVISAGDVVLGRDVNVTHIEGRQARDLVRR